MCVYVEKRAAREKLEKLFNYEESNDWFSIGRAYSSMESNNERWGGERMMWKILL